MTYTEDPDKAALPCPESTCTFVARGKNAQKKLDDHLRRQHGVK